MPPDLRSRGHKNYKTNYNHIEPELMDGIAIDLMPSLVVLEKMKNRNSLQPDRQTTGNGFFSFISKP